MKADCQNCDRLAQENARLVRENNQLRRIIGKQRQAIEATRFYALRIYSQASGITSRKGGVPLGTWSLARGRGEVAREVYHRLGDGG